MAESVIKKINGIKSILSSITALGISKPDIISVDDNTVFIQGRFTVGNASISGVTNVLTGLPKPITGFDAMVYSTNNNTPVRLQYTPDGELRTVYSTLSANTQYMINTSTLISNS